MSVGELLDSIHSHAECYWSRNIVADIQAHPQTHVLDDPIDAIMNMLSSTLPILTGRSQLLPVFVATAVRIQSMLVPSFLLVALPSVLLPVSLHFCVT